MGKRWIVSKPGLLGRVYYYDERGRSIGYTRPGLWGTGYTVLNTETTPTQKQRRKKISFRWVDCEEESPETLPRTILRNVMLFVLCLGVCIAFACIHAVARLY